MVGEASLVARTLVGALGALSRAIAVVCEKVVEAQQFQLLDLPLLVG